MGYDSDLNKALDILKEETIKFLMETKQVARAQAEKNLCYSHGIAP